MYPSRVLHKRAWEYLDWTPILDRILGDIFGNISPRFLVDFLTSILHPFLDFSLRAICLFYGTFSISRCLLDPFSDDFLTVHLPMILPTLGLD